MSLLLAVAGALWLCLAAALLAAALALRRLPGGGGTPAADPLVSVVLAARDEAARIETTIRQLAAQRNVRLEIVAVDDRSRDDTPGVLARLRGEIAALVTLRVDTLPPGWVGKCHALHLGSRHARGDWLLFTDGDIWLAPDVVARALVQADADDADHLALTPHIRPPEAAGAFAYQACLLPMAALMGGMAALANRDHPRSFIGIGAFNLVRRARYQAAGGHAAMPMEVVDDMKLGALLRRSGARTRAYVGDDDVHCEWASDVLGIVRALEKNGFAAIGYRLGATIGATLAMAAMWLAGLLGPLVGGAGWLAAAGLWSTALAGAAHARLHRYALAAGALLPLMLPFPWLVLWNSTLRTLRQGGVRWRDTFYPLAELRAGLVPPP